MRNWMILATSGILFVSCNGGSEIKDLRDKEIESSMVATEMSQKELEESLAKVREEEKEKERILNESSTSLSFDKIVHNFGEVKEDVSNSTNFKVTNTGDKPLIIESVEASCGCTTPQKPEKPILPGQSDIITVAFKPNAGQVGEQSKTVTVTANTKEKVHKLEIKAFVK